MSKKPYGRGLLLFEGTAMAKILKMTSYQNDHICGPDNDRIPGVIDSLTTGRNILAYPIALEMLDYKDKRFGPALAEMKMNVENDFIFFTRIRTDNGFEDHILSVIKMGKDQHLGELTAELSAPAYKEAVSKHISRNPPWIAYIDKCEFNTEQLENLGIEEKDVVVRKPLNKSAAENLTDILSSNPEKVYTQIPRIVSEFAAKYDLSQITVQELEPLPKDRRVDLTFNYQKEFVRRSNPDVSLVFKHSISGYSLDFKDGVNNEHVHAFRYGVSGNIPKVEPLH